MNVELEEEFVVGDENFADFRLGEFAVDFGRPQVAELARWLRQPTLRGLVVMIGDLELEEQEEVFHFVKAWARRW